MENLTKVLKKIESTDLKVNNGKINQTVRNDLKNELIEAIMLDLAELEPVRTVDGVAVAVGNEPSRQTVTFTLDPVFKALDYDIEAGAQEYADKVAEREAKALALAQKKKSK
jgi:hypothetical protein